MNLLNQIPAALVALRCAIAPYLLWDAWDGETGPLFIAAFLTAVLSDIFDGIIARRLGISTAGLRQADSWADRMLYGAVLTGAFLDHRPVMMAWRWGLGAIVLAQILWWGVNLAKYGRPASYHTYTAKLWGVALAVATVALFGWGDGGWSMGTAIAIGLIHTLEEIAMTLLLPTWQHDVLSINHAIKLRQATLAEQTEPSTHSSPLKTVEDA